MKQLTIEQKAEAYDKAIKVIKDNLDALNEITETGAEIVNIQAIKNCFYRAFPELKENKSQGKTVLEAIKEEEEPICYKCRKENSFHSCQDITALGRCTIEHEKPADNDKSKFKVGDWITNDEFTWKIIEVKSSEYTCQSQNGVIRNDASFWWVDVYFHLWTIQDAKDGDVLSWDDSKCIAIFKSIYNEESFNSHGFVGHCTGTFESRLAYHDIKGAHPATKEQCDLLFQKMNEAGYTWDTEKKECNHNKLC